MSPVLVSVVLGKELGEAQPSLSNKALVGELHINILNFEIAYSDLLLTVTKMNFTLYKARQFLSFLD